MNELSDTLRHEVGERLARRPWPTTPLRGDLDVSFEFFPPASPEAAARLNRTVDTLSEFDPAFVSVTYGAGGTSRDRTARTVASLQQETGLNVAAHLTCVGSSRSQIQHVVDQYLESGVSHIVALRGDPPDDGPRGGDLPDAASLVSAIRNRTDGHAFEISVAAYPETHPRAQSKQADLEALKRKIDSGADRAITQFFFDPDDFLRFLESARGVGINVPIVPGIMPISNFAKAVDFADRCGARIPDWMPELFAGLEDTPDVQRMVSATIATEMCRYLVERGVTSFHFYTLNQADLTVAVCRTLGMRADLAAHQTAGALVS
ncbi:MAG: methylenetetrahydrofolate reductase [NAD(P)H] [Acidimicrobiales bacterium]